MKNKLIYLAVALGVAVSSFCANAANLVMPSRGAQATLEQQLNQAKAPLILNKFSESKGVKVASHWSHSSHASHASHASHFSHYSSRY